MKNTYIEKSEEVLKKQDIKNGYIRDLIITYTNEEQKRREFGAHITSVEIFKKFIFPEIKNILYHYTWIDLFAGEGNLILPILEHIPRQKRIEFFKRHILLFDIQKEMVEKCINHAKNYGIPLETAKKNIKVKDTLQNYPNFTNLKYPAYHITNPPYLYVGYIAKNSERNFKYFTGQNEGYQDLYQIALINDLRHNLEKMVYIIPTNFLFGFSVSNKIRKDFLPFYNIQKSIIFERKIFEFTGTNVCICFFERKKIPSETPIAFKAFKINNNIIKKQYILSPKNFYRAGGEFDEFISSFKSFSPLKIKFYLTLDEIEKNQGNIKVTLLDANSYSNGYFRFHTYSVNEKLYRKLKYNPLFVRTLDTGSWNGRVGIYNINEIFGVDGIVVTKEKYRTHPIQLFITPELSYEDLILLKNYFNLILEYLRDITDSEFLTTFKYSTSNYVRKYLGLSQTKKLLETFPIHLMNSKTKQTLQILIEQKNIEEIKNILLNLNKNINNNYNQIMLFKI